MSEVKMQESTLQEDKEKKETTEFIELLRALSRDEQNQVKGYMACLRSVRRQRFKNRTGSGML